MPDVQPILAPDLQRQLNSGRELLAELRDALTRFGAPESGQAALAWSLRRLGQVSR